LQGTADAPYESRRHGDQRIVSVTKFPNSRSLIMSLRHFASTICFALAWAIGPTSATRAAAADRPNIVFIIADDLGWADVAFHGGNAPTPTLDKLAREGVELTQHYVHPLCSPTRASLLSGRYGSRFGVTSPQADRAFPWDTVTLPKALKSVGY